MIPIDVDTGQYEAASHTFGADIGPQLLKATMRLNSGLSGTGAMAGNDQAGLTWARSYDPAAQRAAQTLSKATRASFAMANLLQQTGLNHARAESASARTGDIVDTASYQDVSCAVATAPSAVGGSTSQPHGWSLIAGRINGLLWPDGHQDRPQAAADAWDAAARTLDQAAPLTGQAAEAVGPQRAPEVDDAVRVCFSTGAHFRSWPAPAAASPMPAASTPATSTRSTLKSSRRSSRGWLPRPQPKRSDASGSLCSFGAAEVPTQAAEAGEIAVVASAVETTLGTLATEAVSVAAAANETVVGVSEAATGLEQLAGAEAVVYGAEESVVLPSVESCAARNAVSKLKKTATKAEPAKANYQVGKAAEGRVPGDHNATPVRMGS